MPLWYKPTVEDRSSVQYQEVLPNPTFSDTIKNVRFSNWFYAATWTAVSAVGGYIFGTPYCKKIMQKI